MLVAAGDIASCSSSGDEATAQLVRSIPGTVATLGDNAYETGTAAEFASCYGPTWGTFKARTRPAPGNHEYVVSPAPYFAYFGAAAGPPGKGYYSYELGAWHVVVINSNCGAVGGCERGSPQERWLRADLAAHPRRCALAYWHHARFSSGLHGSDPALQPIWQALYAYGADVVLSGHDHDYERFAPQTPAGARDARRGIRELVAGTGGKSLRPFVTLAANSEVRSFETFGVLKLTLHGGSYDWRFVPVAGETFTDSGSAPCH